MRIAKFFLLILLAMAVMGALACAADQEMLDRHEQALADEDE